MKLVIAAAALALPLYLVVDASGAHAAPPTFVGPGAEAAAAHWRELARLDVEAAYTLLKEDHPAAVPALGDAEFIAALEAGRRLGLERAARVESYEGHIATLYGFARSFEDKHIGVRPILASDPIRWAGLVVQRTGDGWRITAGERPEEAALVGARLVACDGVDAETLGARNLGGFKAVWSARAQRASFAPWLLSDEGNPFIARPARCVFETAAGQTTLDLRWRSIGRTAFRDQIRKGRRIGSAGYGVRPFAKGQWIALQDLGPEGGKVVDVVEAKAELLRAAPVVVLDVRGNGGGSSEYGRRIARALYGADYIKARLAEGVDDGPCSGVWRISERNHRQLKFYADELGPQIGPEAARLMAEDLSQFEAAKARGWPLSADMAVCRARKAAPKPAKAPPPLFKGRLVLLTDNACFSSCLNVADDFRKLGALHVGDVTDVNTHYGESRENRLPSGLAYFYNLQKASLGDPRIFGDFAPELTFAGDIADTPAVEAWIGGLVDRP